MKKVTLFVILLTLFSAFSSQALLKGGLGDVAISPDNKILVAGGDSRVLYVIDPSSLKVKERVWFKSDIHEMEFNKDGSVLLVRDTGNTLYFIKSENWQVFKIIKKSNLIPILLIFPRFS